jgi:hypothetical protein
MKQNLRRVTRRRLSVMCFLLIVIVILVFVIVIVVLVARVVLIVIVLIVAIVVVLVVAVVVIVVRHQISLPSPACHYCCQYRKIYTCLLENFNKNRSKKIDLRKNIGKKEMVSLICR